MKKLLTFLACILALVLCFTACTPAAEGGKPFAQGGVLCLAVNPEIAITYDADGNVTRVDARNDDGSKIVADYSGYEGKVCKSVVAELVTAIGEAGYFVEEVEGERRQIILEIEPGSQLPNSTFLDDVANEVRNTVNSNDWSAPIQIRNDRDGENDDGTCTNPYCNDADCDDADCDDNIENDDDGICTNPYCDDADCDDADCDDNHKEDDDGTCTNPYCNDADCDDADCDDNIENDDDGICTNPYCDDADCDDADCDDNIENDDDGICTNPHCDDDDCDDTDCDNHCR